MNTNQKLKLSTTKPAQSLAWGQKLGQKLKPGQLIEFVGDLGGGKTTIIKGIAKGLGIKKTVTSPTFNVMRSYEIPAGGVLDHYDLYRIGDDDVVARELSEDVQTGDKIIVVEWARPFVGQITGDYLRVTLTVSGEDSRSIELWAVGPRSTKVLEGMR